jgi:(2Fe-2S) ferredoxin
MLNNREEFIAYREAAQKDYAAQKKKIIVCAGTGCVAGGSLNIFDTLKALIEEKGLPVEIGLAEDPHTPGIGLKKSGCHGFCEMGPLVRIEPQGWLYTKVKVEDCAEIVAMGQKVHKAGMGLSVTAITGLGGPEYMEKHAIETAKAFNAMNPEYIGMLTLVVEPETPLEDWVKAGTFKLLTQEQVLEETRLLVENLDCPGSIFRMNHASNYLVLKGTLNEDKEAMLAEIERAKKDMSCLRPDAWRGV